MALPRLIGIPPLAGFVSKWYILWGAAASGRMFAVAVLVVSTLLNAGYFLPIVYAAFFKAPPDGDASHGEAPLPILLAMGVTALLTVFLFAFANQPLELAWRLAAGE